MATFVPWFCWFVWAWLSHSEWYDNPAAVLVGSILGLIGLSVPFAIAMILILPDKEMRKELIQQIVNFKGIKLKYWILNIAIFPVSILVAMAISLIFGYIVSQFKVVEHMSFSAGVFPAWFLLV